MVGVLPADSAFDRSAAQIWYPLAFRPSNMTWDYRWLNASFAVLRPNTTLEQARQQLDDIANRIALAYPNSHKGWGITIERYEDSIIGSQLRTSLLVLMAAVGGLLLICCSNLASLMLVRAVNREGEVAVRASLGAGRSRLLQQFVIEYLVLTVSGGLVGIAIAIGGLEWLTRLLPPGTFPSEARVEIDARVLIFALAVTLLSGVLFALIPLVRAWSPNLLRAMQDSRRGSTIRPARRRVLDGLIVAEVAVAFVLMCGSVLLVRSFVALVSVDTGFSSENVLTMSLPIQGFPPGSIYSSPEEFKAYLTNLTATVDTVPGISRTAVASALPLTDCCLYSLNMQVANRPLTDRANRGGGFVKVVTPSYFDALGLRLRRGRLLNERDTASNVPVIVINERLAARYFPGEDPIGQHILNPQIIPGKTERGPDVSWEIVGVVANEKITALNDDTSAVVYASYEQSPVYFANLAVRTTLAPDAAETAVRQAIHRVNPSQAITAVRTLAEIKTTSVASGRLQTLLMSAFSATALALAAIGLYGVLAYSVALRSRDIGIRAALGASSSTLVRSVLTQGLWVTGLGLVIGLAAAIVLTPMLRSILYGVDARDPYLIAGATTMLVVVSALACWIPARRAALVDPLVVLRGD